MLCSGWIKAAALDVAEMKEADCLAVEAGISSLSLMEAAGCAVAREVVRICGSRGRIVILCGPGNNGGDGFVAARFLAQRGWPVRVVLSCEVGELKGDAAVNALRWKGPVERLSPGVVDGAALVVDALFGAGLNRALDENVAAVIARINHKAIPCLAVDIPSGVNGSDGSVCGDAPRCVATVTFFRPKRGHVLYPGRERTGRLVVADIGIPDTVLHKIVPQIFVNEPSLWFRPVPGWRDHKYSRGHVIVFASAHMSGAARMAAMAARRAGAGIVTIIAPPESAGLCAHDPGVVVVSAGREDSLRDLLVKSRCGAVVIGPGAGRDPALVSTVKMGLGTGFPVVLDADALNVFVGRCDELRCLLQAATGPVVMTPHEGEFSRLFPGLDSMTRLEKARHAASNMRAFLVLKGADTIIAAPDGTAAVTINAVPWLATAGSGDVLAGTVAAHLAGGMDGFPAACAGVWLHAEAGRRLGQGMIAEDMASAFPDILAGLS